MWLAITVKKLMPIADPRALTSCKPHSSPQIVASNTPMLQLMCVKFPCAEIIAPCDWCLYVPKTDQNQVELQRWADLRGCQFCGAAFKSAYVMTETAMLNIFWNQERRQKNFKRRGQWKNQDREIAPIKIPFYFKITLEVACIKSRGRAPATLCRRYFWMKINSKTVECWWNKFKLAGLNCYF